MNCGSVPRNPGVHQTGATSVLSPRPLSPLRLRLLGPHPLSPSPHTRRGGTTNRVSMSQYLETVPHDSLEPRPRDVPVPHPDHAEARDFEHLRAGSVVSSLVGSVVRVAVQLQDEPLGGTIEVEMNPRSTCWRWNLKPSMRRSRSRDHACRSIGVAVRRSLAASARFRAHVTRLSGSIPAILTSPRVRP